MYLHLITQLLAINHTQVLPFLILRGRKQKSRQGGLCCLKAAVFSMEILKTSIIFLAMFFNLKSCPGTENCDEEYVHMLMCVAIMRKLFAFPKGWSLSSTY